MGNNDLLNSENILVKVDQNNLIYIDPNSVVKDGEIHPRGLKQENLVMYANLEADIIPRSYLTADQNQNTLVSIAEGTLNFLKNQNGNDFDTNWTESFNPMSTTQFDKINNVVQAITGVNSNFKQKKNDSTAQSFGIETISITTKGFNAIPQVTINFVDVRGKTLFESPENSPYRAFFHLPWPIFYLTIKGYYGKAIRYRLHLVKFNTKFNGSTGNFEITCDFVGSTYAYLNDIPLNGMLNAPYMFPVEQSKDNTLRLNPDNETYEQVIGRTSKGYEILKSVYNEYKQKGLIAPDFPVKTLKEIIVLAESLDRILEREIFDQVIDAEIFAAIVSYQKNITSFENQVIEWANKNLSQNQGFPTNGKPFYYYFAETPDANKTKGEDKITGTTSGCLQFIIDNNKKILDGDENLSILISKKNKLNIDFSGLRATKNIKDVKDYYDRNSDKKLGVAIDELVQDIRKVIKKFNEQKSELEKKVEQKMNEVVKDPKKGIGFDPTIRNIFAVVLANAEVYIRLLKDVHTKAFEQGKTRKSIIGNLSDETPKEGAIYPWPEIKKSVGGGSKHKVITHPSDPDLSEKLNANNRNLWPEVDFIENYVAVATKKYDTLAEKEGGIGNINFIFSSDIDEGKIKKLSTIDSVTFGLPYTDKSLSSILYEIFERSFYSTLFDNFNDNTLSKDLVEIEFNNLNESIKEDYDILGILKNNINSINDLFQKMKGVSTYERYPYLKDQLPTITYIQDVLDRPFTLEQYYDTTNTSGNTRNGKVYSNNDNSFYPNLKTNLDEYQPNSDRLLYYPYTSNLYLKYIKTPLNNENFVFKNILSINTKDGLVTSPIDSKNWVNSDSLNNIFNQKFVISQTTTSTVTGTNTTSKKVNILNTPYFHKQLYSDFNNNSVYGKYVGSAYLLINSLGFKDLEDDFIGKTKVSSLFREVSATHFVPYHLMVKWGSLYHRYKKFILEGEDILSGFLDTSGKTTNFSGSTFFDNNSGTTFTISGTSVTYSNNKDIGIHPYYDAIFHQIINGYNHYDISSGNTSFSQNVDAGGIRSISGNTNGQIYWTTFVDNSKYSEGYSGYTILPSDGFNDKKDTVNNFFGQEQRSMRIIWEKEENQIDFSGKTFPSYSEYNKTYSTTESLNKLYGFGNEYRKLVDLIGTFSPKILDEFEDIFLRFASEKINEELPYKRFTNVTYYQFQDLLKELCVVDKVSTDSTITNVELINELIKRQTNKLEYATTKILSTTNLISFTLVNPKEIDPHVIYGFAGINTGSTFTYRSFDVAQVSGNSQYIDLYVGEDIDGYYLDFFTTNNIELSEENVLAFRPLILLFAGYKKSNPTVTSNSFKEYLKTKDLYFVDSNTGLSVKQSTFLNNLILKFKNLEIKTNEQRLSETNGYNDDRLKTELYSYFKSFNDKWVGGNSIGQRLLFEEFLFLDKANRDIGNEAYFNLQRLIPLGDSKNQKATLYSVISMLIQGTGFDMRPLPAYINFYGANFSNKTKITPSKNIAKNLFGTYLEVDYQESTPKVIIQYTGPTSKYLDMSKYSKEFKFSDDSFNIQNTNNNPLILTIPEVFNTGDLYKSNRVVAFEVSFGDQNQNIFKGVELDQSSIKNTTESFIAMENLARSESGSNAYQVDIGLYDIYRQASYTCTVTCMGNVMIQPTMYFYLKNVPMFKGTYWITDVSHRIQNNNIVTTFTGTRIPYASLPDPKDSLMASYKPLFDTITQKAIARVRQRDRETTSTEVSFKDTKGIRRIVDLGDTPLENNVKLSPESNYTEFGVPFNGYDDPNGRPEEYIQKVTVPGRGVWLRANVVLMDGENYKIGDKIPMSLFHLKNPSSKIYWEDIKNQSKDSRFYSTRFLLNKVTPDKIMGGTTTFFNPSKSTQVVIKHTYNTSTSPKVIEGPVNVGPNISGYGIAMSKKLMTDLKLEKDGDVVYFKIG